MHALWGPPEGRAGAIGMAVLAAALLIVAPAGASTGAFERTWGKDVVSGNAETGFEVCTVAASCKQGAVGMLGGEFGGMRDVAADAAGNVYIAHDGDNRVQSFDASGGFLRAWGKDVVSGNAETGFEVCTAAASCQLGAQGSLGGEFGAPQGIAADAAGNVYIVGLDIRVQKFDASGGFLRAWGKDVVSGNAETGFEVCTAAASCQLGAQGSLGGEFALPEGIAADAAGNVYVADSNGSRVQKFDASGGFLRAWGKDVVSGNAETGFEVCTAAASCKEGATGGLGGELDFPDGIAADAAGNVYVADSLSNRVQSFDASGGFLRAWGKDVVSGNAETGFEVCTAAASCQLGAQGSLGGEFAFREGIVADAAGNVYVADSLSNRVQKFDASGGFLRAWGKDVVSGNAETGFEVCTAAASCKEGATGGLGGELDFPDGIAADAAGNVYVADSTNRRVQSFGAHAPSPSPHGATPRPSNEFEIAGVRRLKRKGKARVTVVVPGPGVVELDGGDVRRRRKQAAEPDARPAGAQALRLRLSVAPIGDKKAKLRDAGKAKVVITLTYTPRGGEQGIRGERLKLRRRR